jgi:hypothetical protein
MANQSAKQSPIRRRNLVFVGLVSLVTLSIYTFYLIYQWSKELNGLEGRGKYSPGFMLAISIITVGAGAAVIECVFAHELEGKARTLTVEGALPFATVFVAVLNVIAWVLGLFTDYWIVGIAAGVMATVIVQRELNLLALQEPATPAAQPA